MDIKRFESLGDNCEIGFVLREHGVAHSNLLRWTLTTIPVLTKVLESDFDGMYQFENLEPSAPRMLLDRATGLRFHSDMVRDFKFVDNHRAVYDREIKKVEMLTHRLRDRLTNPDTIFIYKDNRNPPEARVSALAKLVSSRGGANMLYVTEHGPMDVGSDKQHGPNLWYGRIDHLADYATANEYSQEVWAQLLEAASASIPRATAGAQT